MWPSRQAGTTISFNMQTSSLWSVACFFPSQFKGSILIRFDFLALLVFTPSLS